MDTYGGYDTYNYGSYGYDVGSAASGVEAVMGGLLVVFGIIVIVCLIISIMAIIGQWKMFKKAGEEGWKSIIPIYSQYTLCKLVGVNPYWILIVFIAGVIGGIIPFLAFVGSILSIYFAVILAISTARSYGKSDGFGILMLFFAPICYLVLGLGKDQYVGPKPMNDAIMGLFNKDNNNNSNANQNYNPNVNSAANNINSSAVDTSNNINPSIVDTSNNMNNYATTSNDISSNTGISNTQQVNNANKFCPQCGSALDGNAMFCPNCGNKL